MKKFLADRFERKYLLLSKIEAGLESTLSSSVWAKIAASTLLLACRQYHVVKIHHALHLGVIRRKEMALKCKVLSVVISMESPFPFNSRESITFCLISAVMAPKKRCRSQHDEAVPLRGAQGAVFRYWRGGLLCHFPSQPRWHSPFPKSARKCL